MNEPPIDLDKHRGIAAQKATDIRRVLADVEASAKLLRDQQAVIEDQILSAPATTWAEAPAKARYLLNLYGKPCAYRYPSSRSDRSHRGDFARLSASAGSDN